MRTWGLGAFLLAGVLVACGGSEKKGAEEPVSYDSSDEEEEESSDDGLIPEEKYGEIKRTFERKTSVVSRCYVEALEAGEVTKSEKGHVTVGLTIQPDGSAADVRVLETSFKSQVMKDCVARVVGRWSFTTLPRSLETSHTYVLQQF